jgi:hypothetical protein
MCRKLPALHIEAGPIQCSGVLMTSSKCKCDKVAIATQQSKQCESCSSKTQNKPQKIFSYPSQFVSPFT